jgi:hypothetical protein
MLIVVCAGAALCAKSESATVHTAALHRTDFRQMKLVIGLLNCD